MQRATSVIRKPAVKAEKVIDIVVLDHEGRHRRRVTLAGQGGTSFLLDLDKATVLNDGDALKLEDGTLIAVKAADQSLIEITAATPKRLMRIAWHIGNRHTPAEIGEEAVWIEPDHVLVEMVRGLGGQARRSCAPSSRSVEPMKPPRRMATGTRMTTDMIMRMTTRPTDMPATTIQPTDSPAMFMARAADTTIPTTMAMLTTNDMGTTTGTHTTRAIVTATATSMAENGALPLFVWLSPAFPVGAFAYSHGLEWAVELGQVNDAAGAQAWIYDLLREGSGRNDAILLAAAHRAVMAGDEKALTEVAELAVALQPSRERHLESTSQGNAFITAARATWPSPGWTRWDKGGATTSATPSRLA